MQLTDNWINGLAEDSQGRTVHLNIRDDLEAFRASGKFRYVIEIAYPFEGESLMPSPVDTEQIEAVDKLLQEAMEADKMAILAASMLEVGRKAWLYVSRTYDPFFDRLEEALEELPLLPLQFDVVTDLEWSYYQELRSQLTSLPDDLPN